MMSNFMSFKKFQYFLYYFLALLLPYNLHNYNIEQPMIGFHLLTPQCNFGPSNASLLSQLSNNSHAPCFLLSALSQFLSMQQSWNFLSLSVCDASFLCSCLSSTESNTTKTIKQAMWRCLLQAQEAAANCLNRTQHELNSIQCEVRNAD